MREPTIRPRRSLRAPQGTKDQGPAILKLRQTAMGSNHPARRRQSLSVARARGDAILLRAVAGMNRILEIDKKIDCVTPSGRYQSQHHQTARAAASICA